MWIAADPTRSPAAGRLDTLVEHRQGMAGPITYWHVADTRKRVQMILELGAQSLQEVTDVGGGKLIAPLKDSDGNVLGLIQSP